MKKQIRKWIFRGIVLVLFLIGLLVTFLLAPGILYANKTVSGNYSVFHNKQLDANFLSRLDQSTSLARLSELYDPALKMDICLKDGSKYPALVEKVLGRDLLTSFYNKIIFTADEVNFEENFMTINGHKWNLTEMLAHAQVHCLEFEKYGLWRSNPIGKHPEWKWEGYPEYIARQSPDDKDLQKGIRTWLSEEQNNKTGWIKRPDGTETLNGYFRYRLLVQYCLDIKKMNFVQLLNDTTREEIVRREMIDWYGKQPEGSE